MAASTTNQDVSLKMRITLLAIRAKYPNVAQLESEVLENWMKEDEANLILLDVRDVEEYEVSHLPGAIFVKPDEPMNQVMKEIHDKLGRQTTSDSCVKIVAYCSLGYRSASMAQRIHHELQRLQETGFNLSAEVYNLEGSIFKWANEGRPMVDCQNRNTIYCHPYNVLFGKLLSYHLRRNEPSSHASLKLHQTQSL